MNVVPLPGRKRRPGVRFFGKKPSRYFTVCLVATNDSATYQAIRRAVRRTLWRKVNKQGHAAHLKSEIKARETSLEVKQYFYQQVKDLKFGLYALTLNKRRVFERLTKEKERVYNFTARLVLDQIPFHLADDRVQLLVDRSMGRHEIQEFNAYIVRQLQGRLDPKVPLNIDHILSQEEPVLQAADLFAWGIFRKHERQDSEWFQVFQEKIRYDELYLK